MLKILPKTTAKGNKILIAFQAHTKSSFITGIPKRAITMPTTPLSRAITIIIEKTPKAMGKVQLICSKPGTVTFHTI